VASKSAVAATLALLHELFPTREVTSTTGEAWGMMFEDWTDEDLMACTRSAAKQPGRKFFPTPPEIMDCRPAAVIDSGKILRQISALGVYNPHGWVYPSIERVRQTMGDAVAEAYAAAGGERCFAADGSVAQDMARRTFAAELKATQSRSEVTPLLVANAAQRTLASGNGETGRKTCQ
jgi:hypothetical protein